MRKQRASQDTGKETWSWHQILWCSDEHLAPFLQLGPNLAESWLA